MTVLKSVVMDGNMQRLVAQGDTVAAAEVIPATIATNAITITAAILGGGFIQRTTTGAGTDTIDTAANIIAGLTAGVGLAGIPAGTTFRATWIQNAAFAITVQATANTGVTVTNGAIAASSVKEFLVTVVNGTPAATLVGTTTNASAVVSGLTAAQASLVTPGMVVTNAVSNLQGTTVIAVNIAAGTITMSGNANATAANQAINFSPVITVVGIGQKLL